MTVDEGRGGMTIYKQLCSWGKDWSRS